VATGQQQVAALLPLPCFYRLMSRFVAASGNLPLNALSGDEVLDDSEDPLLLVPGKLADFFKDAAGFSCGAALPLIAVFMAEQVIHRDI